MPAEVVLVYPYEAVGVIFLTLVYVIAVPLKFETEEKKCATSNGSASVNTSPASKGVVYDVTYWKFMHIGWTMPSVAIYGSVIVAMYLHFEGVSTTHCRTAWENPFPRFHSFLLFRY